MPEDKKVLNFKTASAKRDVQRDASQGTQFGIGNFFQWAMEKYPQLTLGQMEQKMPGLEREYAQEKTMRKIEPDMIPSVNPHESKELNRLRKLSGLEEKARKECKSCKGKGCDHCNGTGYHAIEEDEVTKDVIGHVDNEADMLRKELFKMGKYSVELYKMLDQLPEGDFPHWWQAAKHYLDGELNSPEEESPLDTDQEQELHVINPSGV